MLCGLILYMSGETYSLKSTPHDRFFKKLFHDKFYLLLEFCQKPTERKTPRKNYLKFRMGFEK